jgi:ADP-heptose:LPS heptosyltransferase
MFKDILVYRIGSIGDTVVALPSLWAIRKSFPNAKITYLTNKDKASGTVIAAELLPREIYDELIAYSSYFEMIKSLISKRYDALFYLMNRNRDKARLRRDRLFFGLIAREIYGMKHLEKKMLPVKPEHPLREVESEYEYLLDCIYSEELPLLPRNNFFPDLSLKEHEKAKVIEWLSENCHDWEKKTFIGLMASSAWRSKNWKEEKFIEVTRKLVKLKNVFPLVFGGKKDIVQAERIVSKIGTGLVVAGCLGTRGDAALLQKCKLYIGTDTGTMHLAAAVGVKCVAIFSGIDYLGRWVPFYSGHKIIRKRVECEGCFCVECPLEYQKCLEDISVDEVYQACIEVLESEYE